ncbi:NAD-dependent epimerase/dehydratase family protein [Legionella resiliens]|uniref:SDR family oxidoreductase n=1 Tax=Legionella resiliens TaxID=2905958 RepID=A0ABS8X3B1_9GAMM|nr:MULTISPECIES: SDR family oxidoreductase [unclassified Legionella]MCE0722235.1 SDR family oxidoreductase [Legionella sp. 9fVS26]MCE3531389.1 SDR family oxidoreductase [Legionella sp. 8cVS16]
MKTVIIGRGNLSNALLKKLGKTHCVLLSSADIVATPLLLIEHINNADRCNVILNCFQKSTELFTVNAETIVKNSITRLAIILDILSANAAKINKIIYTSSSSVYGANSNENCLETMSVSPMNIHGALKFACEQLISFYCNKYKIEYTIARIFNIFGGQDDTFSMIYRLIDAYFSEKKITLFNKGQAIRDYIHVDDIVWAYARLVSVTGIPVLNIASGQGISTSTLIAALQSKGISLKVDYADNVNEISVSVANVTLAEKCLGQHQYISAFSYLEQQLLSKVSLC